MSDAERHGTELERYIPQGELADRHAQELALVGLSPEFPARVGELNDALVQQGFDNSFSGFRFTLNPDEHRPKVDVDARYYFPYDVVIEANTAKSALLKIAPKDASRSIANARLNHLREFLDSYPTDEVITLTATKRRNSYDKEAPKPINVPFSNINSIEDLTKLGITPAKFQLEAGF